MLRTFPQRRIRTYRLIHSLSLALLILWVMPFRLHAAEDWLETTDTDFSNGVFNQSRVRTVGTGDSAGVRISPRFGTGADGDITISGTVNINTNTIASGRTQPDGAHFSITGVHVTSITLSQAPNGITTNDEILIINLRASSGAGANVGNYEFLTVVSTTAVSPFQITFSTNVKKVYGESSNSDLSNQAIMIQRVPQYGNVTITGTGILTASDFSASASTGGVLVFRATGTVNVQTGGRIHVDEKGFAGGSQTTGGSGGGVNTAGGIGNVGNSGLGPTVSLGFGIGGSTGGAGGNGNAVGGGGGGGGTPGGGGGGTYGISGVAGVNGVSGVGGDGGAGGTGGTGLIGTGGGFSGTYGLADLSKIFLGSGGGSGASGSGGGGGAGGAGGNGGTGGLGGRGGGILYISASSMTVSGEITSRGANGGNGGNGVTGTGGVGAGGGGAGGAGGGGGVGGAIFLVSLIVSQNGTVVATGGTGGSVGNGGDGGAGGPAAGGGGGTGAVAGAGGTGAPAGTAGATASPGSGGAAGKGRIRIEYASLSGTTDPAFNDPGANTFALYYSSGIYDSDVRDSGIAGVVVDKAVWGETLPAGTALTFQVRANASVFSATDTALAWESVSQGGDPAAAGRYIQYRTLLNAEDASNTPILEIATVTYTAPPLAATVIAGRAISATSIEWGWQDNSSGIRQETAYRVFASSDVQLSADLAADVTTWTETARSTNTYYTRYVRAVNTAATLDSVTKSTATLAATPLSQSFTAIATGQIQANWDANTNPLSTTTYVCESTTDSFVNIYASTNSLNTNFPFASLNPNTTYEFRVRARNQDGIATSDTALGSTSTLAQIPFASATPFSGVTRSTITVSWVYGGNPSGTQFNLERSTSAGFDGSGDVLSGWITAISSTASNLTSNVTYYFQVRARNRNNVETDFLDVGSTKTLSVTVPGSPSHSANTSTSISWSWTTNGNDPGTDYFASDESGNSGWVADAVSWVSGSKSTNTIYTLSVKARFAGTESLEVSTFAWTSIDTPTAAGFDLVAIDSITARALGALINLTTGQSGVLVTNDTSGTNSGWIQLSTWTSLSLSSNTLYSFKAQARNGDGDTTGETALISTYTLLNSPLAAEMTLTANTSTQITVSVLAPPNQAVAQSGSEFDNIAGAGGSDSGKLTGAYTFADDGLSANTTYGYRVRYYNGSNIFTNFSAERTRFTRAAQPAASAFTSVATNQIQANWGANTNPASTTTYICELTTNSFINILASSETLNTNFLFTALTPNTTYEARVRARNNESLETSNTVLGTTRTLSNGPSSPAHTSNTSTSIIWSWSTNNNPTGTQFYASDESGNSGWVADAVSWTSGGKSTNTIYTLSVKARNGDNTETTSVSTFAWTSIDTPTAAGFDLVAVDSITARAQGTLANLTTGQSGVLVTNDTSGTNSGWIQLSTWTSLSLSSNTLYSFKAQARNGDAETTGETVLISTYTLLNSPLAAEMTLTANTSTQITVSVLAPPNSAVAQSGSEFDNIAGSGGSDSGKLTGAYTFADDGLSANTTYGYRVRYYNGSNIFTNFTSEKTRFTLAAQPTSSAFTAVTTNQIQANWGANTNPASTTTYIVELTTNSFINILASSETLNTNFLFAALTPNTTYEARVRARNNESLETSNTVLGTTRTLSNGPSSPAHTSNTSVSISWSWSTNNNPTGTQFYASDESGNSGWVADAVSWTSGGKSTNTIYTLSVKARNGDNTETASVSTFAWTSIDTPTASSFDLVGIDSITARAEGTLSNLTTGQSGVLLTNDTLSTNSGWIQVATWTSISLSSNTLYSFKAQARNGDADTTGETSLISTYTLLNSPLPAEMTLTANTSTQITISISAPPNQATAQTGSEFDNIAGAGGSDSGKLTGAYTFIDDALTPNTTYGYRVRYYNGSNIFTNFSAERTRFTRAAQPAASAFTSVATNQIQANWGANTNPASTTTYICELTTNSFINILASSETLNTSFLFTALTPNTTYEIRVRARNNESLETSNTVLGTTSTLALVPSSAATPFSGVTRSTITVSWADGGNPSGTQFNLERSTSSNFDGSGDVLSGWITAISSTASNLTSNVTYYFQVRARNRDNVETNFLNIGSTLTAIVNPPAVPAHSANTSTSISWSWTTNGNDLGTDYFASDESGNSGWVADAVSWVAGGKSTNTIYTLSVKARLAGSESPSVSTFAWTSIDTPTASSFDLVAVDSITARAQGTLANLTTGQSGVLLTNDTSGTNSGWIQVVTWTSLTLSSNTLYSFKAQARNGDGDTTGETALISTYTLLNSPLATEMTLTANTSSQITVTVNTPPNSATAQSGSEFDNIAGAGGSDSGKLTGVYTFADDGLTPNTTYGYRVRYYNASNIFTNFTSEKTKYTRAAQPLTSSFTAVATNQIQANWLANTNPTSTTTYIVELTTNSFTNILASSETLNTNFLFSALTPNTTYEARVRARNNESLETINTVLGTTRTLSNGPSSPSHTSNTSVSISWSWSVNNNPTGTEFYASDESGNSGWVADGASWTSGGKSTNTIYTLSVKARDGDLTETASVSTFAWTSIDTPTAAGFDLVGIDSITARALGALINLTTGQSGALLTNDTLSTNSGWIQFATWTSISLSSNTLYSFKAQARNGDGDTTGETSLISTYTLLNAPSEGNLTLTANTSTQITVAVAAPPNSATAQTGSEFDNIAGAGGSDSGKLTGAYTFIDEGLTPNTTYGYRVRYYNGSNVETAYGPEKTRFTRAAQPTASAFTSVTTNQIQANWGANTNPTSTTTYIVELTTNSFTNILASSETQSTSFLFSSLTPNTTYEARVRARNNEALETTDTILGSTLTLVNSPLASGFSQVPGISLATALRAVWLANGNPSYTRYEAQISTDSIFSTFTFTSGTNLFADFTGLQPATTYYAQVRAFSAIGESTSFVSLGSTRTAADGTAPLAITDLVASTGLTEGMVDLRWSAPGDDGTAGNATSYLVKFSPTPFNTQSDFDAAASYAQTWTPLSSGSEEQRTLTGLAAGVTYYIAIEALDEGSNRGALSNAMSAMVQVDVAIPSTISDLVLIAVSSNSLTLRWSAPGDDGTVGTASAYDIRYSPIGVIDTLAKFNGALSFSAPAPAAFGSLQTVILTGLSEATTYYMAIRTRDERSNNSGLSNSITGLTGNNAPPLAPVWTSTGPQAGQSQVSLNWVDNSETDLAGYHVYRSTLSGGPYNRINSALLTQSQYTDSGLTNGVTYFYVLKAVDTGALESGYSAERSAMPQHLLAPEAPSGIQGSLLSDGRLSLKWNPVLYNQDGSGIEDLSGYRIYRTLEIGGTYSLQATLPSSETTWTQPVPVGGYYTVRAVDTAGQESENSMALSATLDAYAASEDQAVTLVMSFLATEVLRKESNGFSEDIRIKFTHQTGEEKNKVLLAYDIIPLKSVSRNSVESVFVFPKARPDIILKVPGLGSNPAPAFLAPDSSLKKSDVALFWYDGYEWIKLGGKVDVQRGVIALGVRRLGKFQVRQVARATSFTLNKVTPNKIFTPNGDSVNDVIEFFFENPSESVVSQAKVYDASGAEVADLKTGSMEGSLSWDGRDKSGDFVSSGVYFYQIESGGELWNGTVVVAR